MERWGRCECISSLRSSSVAVGVLCPPRVRRIRNPDAGVLLWGDHMAPFVVALGIAGVILILVGLVGGGFTISTTAMPKVGNWVRVPCFGVGVVLVVAAVGLGFNNSNPLNPPNPPPSTSPAAVVTTVASPSPSPTDTSPEIATGIIYAPPGYSTIYVYSEPSPSSSVVASVADGITIGILCTSQGDVVTNEDTSQSSSLWDRTSEGFIPDVYVYTGTDQATMTNC